MMQNARDSRCRFSNEYSKQVIESIAVACHSTWHFYKTANYPFKGKVSVQMCMV